MAGDRPQRPIPDSAAKEERRGHASDGQVYQLRIEGHLDADWSEWFEGSRIVPEEGGTTVLISPVADQPALHGLLAKIRDLGLTLLAVRLLEE